MRRAGVALLLSVALTFACNNAGAAQPSLSSEIQRIFATPTPTPSHKKHKKTPTPSPTPKHRASPTPIEAPSAKPSASSPRKAKKRKKESPAPSEIPTPSPSPSPAGSASPLEKKGAPATISPEQIVDYDRYPPPVRKITELALDLTKKNLGYKYGSADPVNGGMDCSGFVYFVLNQSGMPDVPRDSSQQYVWVRKAGTFRAVNSRKDNSFELDELAPGDLLFWTGTYEIDRDPPITHAMIYLGRDKGTNKRIMIGASDGRIYAGESRYGVSVFDFKIERPVRNENGKLPPVFIGYAHIPGLK